MLIERRGDIAWLCLRAGKANAMSGDVLRRIIDLVDEAEQSDARALVIIGEGNAFSAGLALPTLIELDRPAMAAFIDLFAEAMLRVFRLGKPVVAAVNGHAVAGGCVLALQADARLMTDAPSARIGLNEVRLGIGLPSVVVEPLRLVVPPTSLTRVALDGELYAPSEAHRLGLVDEVVPAAELEARATARAKGLGAAAGAAFAQCKAALRRPALEAVARHGEAERERWLDTWFSPGAQHTLRETVARLARR